MTGYRQHPITIRESALRINLKWGWSLSALLLLAACDGQQDNVTVVRSQPLSPASAPSGQANTKTMTLGEALDKRPACDRTVWLQTNNLEQTGGQPATVEYQCDLSTAQIQVLFSAQWTAWVERHQRRLADSEKLKTAALDKKNSQQTEQALSTARWLFDQLQASGDLARYRSLVTGSPVQHLRLDGVNAFFASPEGLSYLATTLKTKKKIAVAQAALKAVTQTVTSTGLATDTKTTDVCQAPALFVLAVVLTPEEIDEALSECDAAVAQRYQTDIDVAEGKAKAARTMLETLNAPITLEGAKEVITWTVPESGVPQLSTHVFELTVNARGTPRQVTKTLGIDDSEMSGVLNGSINSTHQNALISAMSDLVR